MVFPLLLPCTLCLIAALPCVTTVSGKGCFMVLYVAWRPMFNALHSLPRLFCTLLKVMSFHFCNTLERKRNEKNNITVILCEMISGRPGPPKGVCFIQ